MNKVFRVVVLGILWIVALYALAVDIYSFQSCDGGRIDIICRDNPRITIRDVIVALIFLAFSYGLYKAITVKTRENI